MNKINDKDYKVLTPFKGWVIENFPFIEADFDAITNYELYCKIVEYLNNVIYNQNQVQDLGSELVAGYNDVVDYVNDYFDNLDVQEEINTKLDKMAEDGSLGTLLQQYVNPIVDALSDNVTNFTNQFSTNLTAETTARTTADNSLQNQISNIVASAGTSGTSSSEIVDARTNTKSTTFTALNDRINFIEKTVPFMYQAVNGADFNDYVTPGKYLLYGTLTNAPSGLNTTGVLIVEATQPSSNTSPVTYQYIVQRWFPVITTYTNTGFAIRCIQRTNDNPVTYSYRDWNIVNTTYINKLYNGTQQFGRNQLTNNFATNGSITTTVDLNTLTNEGNYLLLNANNTNIPASTSILIVNVESNNLGTNNNNWCVQTARDINSNEIYQRVIRVNTSDPSASVYGSWKKIYPTTSGSYFLTGKKVVNFGDSIIGNFRDSTSVSSNISNITNATVYNCGFGGCHMSDWSTYSTKWGAFSMTKIAYAIANNDWSIQNTAIANTGWSDKPDYFDSQLASLKAIDFSTVDYATISYGTNDYAMGKTLDNANNPLDTSTVCGALRYSIETLQGTFPNLRLIICTPTLRLWDESGNIITSDTKTFGGGFNLKQLVNKFKEISLEYHVPIVDAYNELGINKFCYTSFFTGADLTHPNAYGRKQLARLYSDTLLK